MTQQSGARSPRANDQQAQETQEAVEQADEDQPTAEPAVGDEDKQGTPAGMSAADVSARSDLARHLGVSAFPASRAELLAVARENQAPDAVLSRIASAEDREYENMQDLAAAAGIGTEESRS